MSCKTCALSAACVAVSSPGELFLVQCKDCGATFVDVTEPDDDVRLREVPNWNCCWGVGPGQAVHRHRLD